MQKKTPLGRWIEKIYIRFTFAENTLFAISHKSQEPSFREVMDSLVLVAYASLATSRNILQWLLTILNFTIFIVLVQTKKMISINCGSSTSSWKPWRLVQFDLILTMRDIYINSNMKPLTKVSHRARMSGEFDSRKDSHSTKFKWQSRIFIKLCFGELHDSKLSGLQSFDNMAIVHWVEIG